MADDPMDKMPAVNRVSIRAVLVEEGDDAGAALAATGFAKPVAIPVVFGNEPGLASGTLGNGITPNLTAVLETEQEDVSGAPSRTGPSPGRSNPNEAQPSGPVTATLPAAFGMKPLAPIRKFGG